MTDGDGGGIMAALIGATAAVGMDASNIGSGKCPRIRQHRFSCLPPPPPPPSHLSRCGPAHSMFDRLAMRVTGVASLADRSLYTYIQRRK